MRSPPNSLERVSEPISAGIVARYKAPRMPPAPDVRRDGMMKPLA